MRVYISADMEGVNGVVTTDHVDPSRPLYSLAREWMISEVNAVIEGCAAAGAKEVVVNDSHNTMTNLLPDRLHPTASVITGSVKPLSMMQGMDETFDAALFVGYHAKMGTPGAVQDHTYSASTLHDVRVNGLSTGEFGLNAGLAGHFGVPVVFVSGDEALTQEARGLVEDITAIAVKKGVSRYAAVCLPFAESLRRLRDGARAAVKEAAVRQPLRVNPPYVLACEFQKTELADRASRVENCSRVDAFTLQCETDNFLALYESFLALLRSAF